jgi:hypothetical protein
MMAEESQSSPSQGHSAPDSREQGAQATLTPEQVREIADQVYALLLRELKQERDRISTHRSGVFRGGRS